MKTNNFLTLDRKDALELIKIVKLPGSVKQHSIKVANKGLEIANKITKEKVNKNLVEIGGLLHDIGRSLTHGFNHGLVGGNILRERGFPEKICRICETHILGGLDKDDARVLGLPEQNFIPLTIEEKIICLADKYIIGIKEVDIEERFENWFKKYGKTSILVKSKKRINEIEKEIKNLM